jgi:1,4-alpha-glucan branching enzyme
MEPKGYQIFVLHSHLPFVKHPEYENFLEERWLFEGVTETYLQLLLYFEQLVNEGVDFQITMSITPALAEMFVDPVLQNRTLKYIENLVRLGESEIKRTRGDDRFYFTALHYYNRFLRQRDDFVNKYHKNLIEGFLKFKKSGHLEIITCTGPHLFLPNFQPEPSIIRMAIRVAKRNYIKHFGEEPKGIWLAENGYFEDCDKFLADENIRYFFLETHGILYGNPKPVYGVFAPVYTPNGVAAFGRDVETAKQVWSASEGYPGDYNYREFYRDIGFQLPMDYLKPFLPEGIRVQTGFKYYKITGKTEDKQPYNREVARNKAAEHAGNFLFNRTKQVEYLASKMDRPPVVVSMYDAELFGHWWYEGPEFIYYLIKKMHYDQNIIKMITPTNYLRKFPTNQVVMPNFSSWGYKGYSEVWLNGDVEWILYYLYDAIDKFKKITKEKNNPNPEEKRVLNQMARELLLGCASDWPFIITTKTTVEYAIKRVKEHIHNFNKLYYDLLNNYIDYEYLKEIEQKNSIFQEIDYQLWN